LAAANRPDAVHEDLIVGEEAAVANDQRIGIHLGDLVS
jgi:hypothetical protein